MTPPPIVVTEVTSKSAAPELPRTRSWTYDNAMPAISKSSISVADARVLPSRPSAPLPNKQRPGSNSGYLHPFSAVERCFSAGRSSVKADFHQRSCPSSPVGRNLSSGGTVTHAPALQLDTKCHDSGYNYIEIAMEVAEEAARI